MKVNELLEVLDCTNCTFGVYLVPRDVPRDSYSSLMALYPDINKTNLCYELIYDLEDMIKTYGSYNILKIYTDLIVDETCINELSYSRWIALMLEDPNKNYYVN